MSKEIDIRCNEYNEKSKRTCNKLLFKIIDGKVQIKCPNCGKMHEVEIIKE